MLKSSNAGDRLEAELAQLVQGEGYTLTNVHTNVNGPTGTVGDYDVTTPDVILEAKSGQSWDSRATRNVNKLLGYGADGAIMNPDGKPVLVYAPSMPEDKVLWIQQTGAYVAQNPEQLFILLWYLSPPH